MAPTPNLNAKVQLAFKLAIKDNNFLIVWGEKEQTKTDI